MKKLIVGLMLLLVAGTAHADLISFDQLTSDASVTLGWLNTTFWTIYNDHNYGIKSVNISNGSLMSDDFADSANPIVRDYELIGDYVYSGLTPATAAGLTSDISAGTAYVSGNRIVKAATSHTYTASKNTWVYIDHTGAYQFKEVELADSQPTTDSNHILLAKVVTSGAAITTVTDYAQRTPQNMRIYTNYRAGVRVSPDTATTVVVTPGEIELGTTGKNRTNTNPLTLTMPTDLDTGVGAEAASTYYYVFVYPNPSNSTNYSARFSTSSNDVTDITNERLVGWFYNDAFSNITSDAVSCYKGDGAAVPNYALHVQSADVTSTQTGTWADVDGLTVRISTSGNPIKMETDISWLCNNGAFDAWFMFNVDGVDIMPSMIITDTGSGNVYNNTIHHSYILSNLGVGTHIIKVKHTLENTGSVTFKTRKLVVQEL